MDAATSAPGAPAPPPERLGEYTIVGPLAQGGMAEIFLARRVGLEGFARSVVVKRILPHLAASDEFVTMFLDEARIAAGIQHPNVVSVEELGREGESLFMVMEYLAGESLLALLRELRRRGRSLPPRLAAHIAAEAAAGLHAAHEMRDDAGRALGVVHRDVSPQNVFITYDGAVKVLDFGVAKAADRLTRTQSGQFKGKFAYMAPEQLRNEDIDRRADVFALGVVFFEMLTSRRLFKRDSPAATLSAVLNRPVPKPSSMRLGVPAELDRICRKALARSRSERYRSAADLRRDLVPQVHAGGDGLADESLRTLMQELFADRAHEKAEMIRKVHAGEPITHLVQEFDSERDALPPIQSEIGEVGQPRQRNLLALGLAAIVLVGAGAAYLATRPDAVATRPPEPAEPATITLHVASSPPGATVEGPDGTLGRTPLEMPWPRASDPLALRFVLEGHEPWSEEVVPDADQRIRVRLLPLSVDEEDPPAADVGETTSADDRPRPTKQRTMRTMRPTMTEAQEAHEEQGAQEGQDDFPLW